MTPADSEGPELLRREILDEASRQRDEILSRARDSAMQSALKAEQTSTQILEEKLNAARAEAERRAESILATVTVSAARMRSNKTEEVLQLIQDEAREQLRQRDGARDRETIVALAVYALSRMAGESFVLKLSSEDSAALGDGLADEIRRRLDHSTVNLDIREDPSVPRGRWLLQDGEGRQTWDLGLESRLDRLWPQLRRCVAAEAKLITPDLGNQEQHEHPGP